jgi:DNA polymerase-3 subunit delta'
VRLLGHPRVVARLWAALDRGDLHHALLLEGPAGVGKRTLADLLVQAANCTGATGLTRPCGTCRSCAQIASGNHPDILRLEPDPEKATPTIGVDAVREVVRLAGFHRFSGARRFVVIDPAEALQASAANALLKTLEEPPAGTGFILIATHASALLPTIVSRCQRHRLGPVPEPEIAAWLSSRGEADAPALARAAEGCPGRAVELAAGGLQRRSEWRDGLLQALAGDLGQLFDFSEKLVGSGSRQEWTVRVEGLLAVIEDLLRDVVAIGSGIAESPERPPVDPATRAVTERWATVLWPGGVVVCADAVQAARENLAANVAGRTVVDALLTRLRRELGSARRAA